MNDHQKRVYRLHRRYGVPAIVAYHWAMYGQVASPTRGTPVCSMYWSGGYGVRCYAVCGLS